ncbi:hypothetical protein CQW23_24898 [Capsicum baccatum]|uniref:Uncharacterized protein n=1 Tax=Capsicum baccatum TaxID=33114 RepID=A0A2G2VW39_CAPBA|nr:hypothetical protein CQW23_24898 [Capsicum baccatum]
MLWVENWSGRAREVGDRPSVVCFNIRGYLGGQTGETARMAHFQGQNRCAIAYGSEGGPGLLCCQYIPDALTEFLSNPRYAFAGVGIASDAEKLEGDYQIFVENTVDLRL